MHQVVRNLLDGDARARVARPRSRSPAVSADSALSTQEQRLRKLLEHPAARQLAQPPPVAVVLRGPGGAGIPTCESQRVA